MNKVWQIGFLLLFLWMGMTLSWELNRAVASEMPLNPGNRIRPFLWNCSGRPLRSLCHNNQT